MQNSGKNFREEIIVKPKTPAGPLNVDDMVLPAITAGGASNANGPSEYAPGEEFYEEESKQGEPIAADKRDIADPLIPVFGDNTIRKVFSRTWMLREEGIGEVESQILQGQVSDVKKGFTASITVIKETIVDKLSGVCLRAIKFLENLCNNCKPNLSGAQEREVSGSSTNTILSTLIEKLGDNLQKVRVAAEDAILAMCEHPCFGVKVCLNAIMRTVPV